MLQPANKILTPEQDIGVGHFHHTAIAARREQQAAHLAAKVAAMAAAKCSTKKAQRRQKLHEVAPIEVGATSESAKRPPKERYHFRRR